MQHLAWKFMPSSSSPHERDTNLPVNMADFDLFSTKVGQQKWLVQMLSGFAYDLFLHI